MNNHKPNTSLKICKYFSANALQQKISRGAVILALLALFNSHDIDTSESGTMSASIPQIDLKFNMISTTLKQLRVFYQLRDELTAY